MVAACVRVTIVFEIGIPRSSCLMVSLNLT